MSKTISSELCYRTLILAAFCFATILSSTSTIQAQGIVLRKPISNNGTLIGEIVVKTDGYIYVYNHTNSSLWFQYTTYAGNRGKPFNRNAYINKKSFTRYIADEREGIRGIRVYHVGPNRRKW